MGRDGLQVEPDEPRLAAVGVAFTPAGASFTF
jgi:hypothetical protein